MHLLIEAGCYGISFIWFHNDPLAITGLVVYNFTENKTSVEMAAEIEKILQSNSIFNDIHASVTICYFFKESMLIPADHYKAPYAIEMLDLVHNSGSSSQMLIDRVNGYDSFNIYAVDKSITGVLSAKFPTAIAYDSTSLLLETMNVAGSNLYCTVFHNCVSVFLFNAELLFAGQFHYKKPVDAAYHLLNCCQQYDIDPSKVNLQLSGMIDVNSNLYNELYKYFLSIEFELLSQNIPVHERIQFYPAHFFSHLNRLVSCVS